MPSFICRDCFDQVEPGTAIERETRHPPTLACPVCGGFWDILPTGYPDGDLVDSVALGRALERLKKNGINMKNKKELA